MATTLQRASLAFAATIALAGCSDFIKKDQYDTDIAALKSADQNLQSQIDGFSQKYDTLAQEVAGRVRIDTGALSPPATPGSWNRTSRSSRISRMRRRAARRLVTVEGFADPQGATGYNRKLGMQRANAVPNTSRGTAWVGEPVAHRELRRRQESAGAAGPDRPGRPDNRRVSLVIDFAGATAALRCPHRPPHRQRNPQRNRRKRRVPHRKKTPAAVDHCVSEGPARDAPGPRRIRRHEGCRGTAPEEPLHAPDHRVPRLRGPVRVRGLRRNAACVRRIEVALCDASKVQWAIGRTGRPGDDGTDLAAERRRPDSSGDRKARRSSAQLPIASTCPSTATTASSRSTAADRGQTCGQFTAPAATPP